MPGAVVDVFTVQRLLEKKTQENEILWEASEIARGGKWPVRSS
jgi:hypothetical protein